ncbi:hypothetical protein CDAR_240011 [Caerostris darwini]|uniref:Secreted protein n=1 Tax=Caerostris darwini TaxID=1538125 RepID=A0AAV4SGI5_9ARAC|nr:hypothetical protein CDAR_240011 [Caerostris darwini]
MYKWTNCSLFAALIRLELVLGHQSPLRHHLVLKHSLCGVWWPRFRENKCHKRHFICYASSRLSSFPEDFVHEKKHDESRPPNGRGSIQIYLEAAARANTQIHQGLINHRTNPYLRVTGMYWPRFRENKCHKRHFICYASSRLSSFPEDFVHEKKHDESRPPNGRGSIQIYLEAAARANTQIHQGLINHRTNPYLRVTGTYVNVQMD